MKTLMMALMAALALAAPLRGQEPASPAIEQVIRQQLEAFKADDFETAFTFASPTIKRIFRTPEVFGQMVQRGYPMVYRPAEVDFLGLRGEGDRLRQTVRINDAEGTAHLLEYEMIATDQGWQINGVRFIPRPELGV